MANNLFSGKKLLIFIIFLLISSFSYSANVTVPSFEIYTRGLINEKKLELVTRGELDLVIEGGYKFGGKVSLGFNSDNLENDFINRETGSIAGLTFNSASITIRDLFGSPLYFSYFIGENDIFASGIDFDTIFGIESFSTSYSGYVYFADRSRIYEGIHQIAGTGIKMGLKPINEKIAMSWYLYQDAYFDTDESILTFEPGHFSFDYRLLCNFGIIHLETFAGGTYPAGDIAYFRSGVLFHVKEDFGEFLAEIGIPRWSPGEDEFGRGLFFLLFESRLNIGIFSFIPTVFMYPDYYLQDTTGEDREQMDFNLKFHFSKEEAFINGGLETNLALVNSYSDLNVKIAPYIGFITPGVLWQLKINTKVVPFEADNMFDAFISINAKF
jgi:hypothetical protein